LAEKLPPWWVKNGNIPALGEEIVKIREYKPRHITVYEEPPLDLLIKYYRRKLAKKDWLCFGGFKTLFICFSKNEPLVYSCHGICGNLNKVSLKNSWRSKEARKLRIHSRNCDSLCMQSCYSLAHAQSLSNLARFYLQKVRKRHG
jgi:hypothetical protein